MGAFLFSTRKVDTEKVKEVCCMDIAGLSMAMATNNVQSQVSTAVLSKSMDSLEQMGQGLVEMIDAAAMERSVNPGIGANFDLRV